MGFDLQWERGEGDGGYYHFNLGRMGLMLRILDRTGVVDWTVAPPWGDGLTRREQERVLAFRSPRRGQVPAAKFCTNDGWLVTATECRLLAAALATRGAAALGACE